MKRDGRPVSLEPTEATVGSHRLYHIITDQGDYDTNLLEIIIERPGLQAFAFTFD